MSQIVIGISGEIKAGKSLVASHLKSRYGFCVDLPERLARGLDVLGLPRTTENMLELSIFLRKPAEDRPHYGQVGQFFNARHPDYNRFCDQVAALLRVFHFHAIVNQFDFMGWNPDDLGHVLGSGFCRGSSEDILRGTDKGIVVDGIYRQADATVLQLFPLRCHVHIAAPIEDRFGWAMSSAEKTDDGELTWERFLARNQAESESEIHIVARMADLRVENSRHKTPAQILSEVDAHLDALISEHDAHLKPIIAAAAARRSS